MTRKPVPLSDPPIEPALQLVRATASWLPPEALRARSLDITRWQTRAARGLAWHASGRSARRGSLQ